MSRSFSILLVALVAFAPTTAAAGPHDGERKPFHLIVESTDLESLVCDRESDKTKSSEQDSIRDIVLRTLGLCPGKPGEDDPAPTQSEKGK